MALPAQRMERLTLAAVLPQGVSEVEATLVALWSGVHCV